MEFKKEELYEFKIEDCGGMDEDPEPIDDPLSACIKIELEEIPETNDTIALTDEIIPEDVNCQRVSRFREKKEKHNFCSSDRELKLVSDINNVAIKSRFLSWRQRKHGLESLEESKARRFRSRITTIKSRLIAKLELPDSELEERRKRDVKRNVLRRKKRLAKQTPEEIDARKISQAEKQRWARNCLKATESAEEMARRKTKEREQIRNYRAKRLATESEKERAARLERERRNRERFKQRKLEKSRQQGYQLNTAGSTALDR